LILTDSGGIRKRRQVSAKTRVVMREVTERTEELTSRNCKTNWNRNQSIFDNIQLLLDDTTNLSEKCKFCQSIRDGTSSSQIVFNSQAEIE